jgi:hypothetical protein
VCECVVTPGCVYVVRTGCQQLNRVLSAAKITGKITGEKCQPYVRKSPTGMEQLDSALYSVDLPTLGMPTRPHCVLVGYGVACVCVGGEGQ